MRAPQLDVRDRGGGKRAMYVSHSLFRCQSGLSLGRSGANQDIGADRNLPQCSEHTRQALTLIVTTLAQSGSGERHWYQGGSFFDDIGRPVEACHAHSRPIGNPPPPFVFQRVHDALARIHSGPTDAAGRTHVRRKIFTPAARVPIGWMSTAPAPWRRQKAQPRPAAPANDPMLGGIEHAATARAADRQDEVRYRGTSPPNVCLKGGHSSQRTDCHIALRSGGKPNHRSNATAPCSTSMPSPSAARRPRSRAARTHAVSPRR